MASLIDGSKLEIQKQIELQMTRDDGDAFRCELGKVIMDMDDAYRPQGSPFRSHLGASMLGRKCARELWYGFRWFTKPQHSPRLMRLFNRGHLEEARFIALLRSVQGVDVTCAHPETGNQFRMQYGNGHGGGSLDSLIFNIPDLPNEWILGEYKTHGDKSFKKLKKDGVAKAKPEHVVQMQCYMGAYGLQWALYMAVNKNDDELYCELVRFDHRVRDKYLERGEKIIVAREPPPKISNNPTWFECKFCDHNRVCHQDGEPVMNCRTCVNSEPIANREWWCHHWNRYIQKELMETGCDTWDPFKSE